MNRIKQYALYLFLLTSSHKVYSSELEHAVEYGNLLTSAVNNKAHVKLKKLPQYKDIRAFLKSQRCNNLKYKAYVIESGDSQFFYLVGSERKSITIGRHFKAPITDDVIDISAFESSTNSCFSLSKPKLNVVALSATHLKPFPNEFHVLQSNLHSIPLYIRTSEGLFSIKNSQIRKVKDADSNDDKASSGIPPVDKPVSVSSSEQMAAFFKAQEPYNKKALESYPQAKVRFLNGLPNGESFFLTTRLHDSEGRVEQVFILVDSITNGVVSGKISNDIRVVSGYQSGQTHEFSENVIYDWLITKPDGSEEGNFVGKYIDSIK